MRKIILFLLITILLAASCEPIDQDMGTRTFLIKTGEHYSTPRIVEFLQSDRLVFDATFDASAKYTFGDRGHQSNKNKLMGFSDCNAQHHENSARFAWQWFNDRLEIFAYCYVNNERIEQFIDVVEIGTSHRYEIVRENDAYIFLLDGGKKATIQRDAGCNRGMYYLLYPYFGGSLPAPHDVTIKVKTVL